MLERYLVSMYDFAGACRGTKVEVIEMQEIGNWEKTRIVGPIIASVVIAIAGWCINVSIENRDINMRFIEVAISVLREEPDKNKCAIRKWAIDVVQENASEKARFSEDVLSELRKTALPSRSYLVDREGRKIVDSQGRPINTVRSPCD